MPTHSAIEAVSLQTSDEETLEGQLVVPAGPVETLMVLCHPHPLHGGNMTAGVIDGLFDRLPEHGTACLRFNFRGVGASTGTHDEGKAERNDVAAAIDELGGRYPDLRLIVGGWSFGADVSLAVDHQRHDGWFSVAPPLSIVRVNEMAAPQDSRSKVLAVPEHDQFNPPDKAATTTADWVNTSQWTVPNADHFLAGRLDRVVELAQLALAPAD
ncbi:MAG: alpha/beta superfamily hydrolase [Acidimicrobiales bacterium]|jgi:alpha/beta superfamily hydrolase